MKVSKIKELYNKSKSSKVGQNCKCPSCGTSFVKASYQQAFCKSKGGTLCKDKYWNTVIPEKRKNTTRISPASAMWMGRNQNSQRIAGYSQAELDRIDREINELNNDGSWDSHQCYVERCEFCECINCRCDSFESSFD